MIGSRISDIKEFYLLLDILKNKIGGTRTLNNCTGRNNWPIRGVYFFLENGETRTDSGTGARVVRVGTHALKSGSKTTIWNRLSQHRGNQKIAGGNHRGSIFRLITGTSLLNKNREAHLTWGKGNTASKEIRAEEQPLEAMVSCEIGAMPFIWITIEDASGPDSARGYIERNAIALLSNYEKEPIDPPSSNWLGHYCDRQRVCRSGLWNNNHVNENYDPEFLLILKELITKMEKSTCEL